MKESDVAPYLLRRGLLDAASIVGGGVRILDASRRNANFRVVRDDGDSYLVKKGLDREGFTSSSREAAVYRLLWSDSGPEGIRPFLPRLFAFDDADDVLVIELFAEANDMRQHHLRTGRCSTRIAAAVGVALATLHGRPLPDGAVPEHGLVAPEPPGFYMHRPGLHVLNELSAACLEALHLAQSIPEVGETLDLLRKEWRPYAFIHNDLRWDNVLLVAPSSGRPRVKLVDWETAGTGDPAWDVGSFFGDYLSVWLTSIPFDAQGSPDAYLHLAGYPLESVRPALRSCWEAYVRTAQLDAAGSDDLLVRVAQFAGVKLMQNSLEQLDRAPACTPTAVCLLQTGLNIVLRPHDALASVLRLPLMSRAV